MGRSSAKQVIPAPASRGQAVGRPRHPARTSVVPPVREAGEIVPLAVNYPMRRWSVADGATMPPKVELFEPLGHPAHYRIRPVADYAGGQSEFCGLGDGFFVHVCNIVGPTLYRASISAPDMLRVRIASADDAEYIPAAPDGDRLRLKGPNVAIIIEPGKQPSAEATFEGDTLAASVFIHRSTLRRLYTDREYELPAPIQAFIAGTLDRTIARPLQLGPALLRCLDDLSGCELEGHGRRLFIRSKAVEILCHAFSLLGQDEQPALPDSSTLTRRGVLRAQQLLAENFVTPPSLDDLAHAVGLSRSGLCSGFRQILGMTVFNHIAELRMRHALALLIRHDASITEIAYEVGYSHPSSFSLAVQRRFGTTPGELRKRALRASSTNGDAFLSPCPPIFGT